MILVSATVVRAASPSMASHDTTIRMGRSGSITAVHHLPQPPDALASQFGSFYPHPRPRLVGFSPQVAIVTSNKREPGASLDFEHQLEDSYTCNPFTFPTGNSCGALNPPATQNFVVGILDSGSDVDFIAGASATILGTTGSYLTGNTIPIGGVGGMVNASISQPIGFYAAGLSSIHADGSLNMGQLVGHSNVSTVVAPPFDCGNGEAVTAFAGMPFLAFRNSVIRVDTPRRVVVTDQVYSGPDVQIQDVFDPLPAYAHLISIEFGGFSPASTASYFAGLDPEDFETPVFPTLMSLFAGTLPTGGLFFATILVREGPSDLNNPVQPMRVMVDTGAQSSVMSEGMAANLNLPLTPDFTVDVCGVGGLVEGVPGYYVDYVKMNARGGALEFSRAPFVVIDLPSPEGGTLDGILGMNFFWNRNVIFEPSLTASAFLHVSDPVPFSFADADVDWDVDGDDSAALANCFTGPGMPVTPECDHFDGDADGDVDLVDFVRFLGCYSSADIHAGANCGND